jgi:hypothetical protein
MVEISNVTYDQNWFDDKEPEVGDYILDCKYEPGIVLTTDGYDICRMGLFTHSIGYCSIMYCGIEVIKKEYIVELLKKLPYQRYVLNNLETLLQDKVWLEFNKEKIAEIKKMVELSNYIISDNDGENS